MKKYSQQNKYKQLFWPILSGVLAAILMILLIKPNVSQLTTTNQKTNNEQPSSATFFSPHSFASAV